MRVSKIVINRSAWCYNGEIGSFEIFEISLETAELHHDMRRVPDRAGLEMTMTQNVSQVVFDFPSRRSVDFKNCHQ